MKILKLFGILLLPFALQAQQADLFFSEYLEGSSNNKALEIYNPTNQTVDLTQYLLRGTGNEATTWEFDYSFPAGAQVGPNEVFVIVDDAANPAMLAVADWVATGFEVGFNGNDARGLFYKDGANLVLLDLVGDPNNPTALDYAIAGVSAATKEHTLVRKSSVSAGNTNWAVASGTNADDSEWIVYNQDDFSHLGTHQFDGPPGEDGKGTVSIDFAEVPADTTFDLSFYIAGEADFVMTRLALIIPATWPWSKLTSDVLISGTAFATGTVSLNGDTVFVDNSALTQTETGTLTIKSITSPAAAERSKFTILTSSASGSLKEIAVSPAISVIKILTIAQARALPVGSIVLIEGVITIGAGITRTSFTDAYIQDESGAGLNVYKGGTDLDPLVVRGNRLRLQGEIDEYSGKFEITNYTATLLATDVELPGVQQISTLEASTLEYEGSFVEVKAVITDLYYAGGGTNLIITDGSGEVTVRVWDTAGLDLSSFKINDRITVFGVISPYNSAGQILLGYQNDISLVTYEEAPVTLKLAPHPFAPELGERMPIEFSAGAGETHVLLRIFDLSGRLVITLADEAGLPVLIPYYDGDGREGWNGRDQLGEKVPVGTYICHLDVVNEKTGKRTVRVAPIVVGTKLN